MIYIVIPVFNRLHFTIKCLNSLLSQTYKDFQIILVDDGSIDGTSEYVHENFLGVEILRSNGNLWWTGATNLGVHKALELAISEKDYILTLNNDLVVGDKYLENLLQCAETNPKTLIGSVSVDINNSEIVHYAGVRWNSRTAKYKSNLSTPITYSDLATQNNILATDLLPGRGVLIPINVFHEIGLYDFESFPHYMADEDFSLRAKKAGYSLLVSSQSVVYSHVNETGLRKQARTFKYYKDVFTSIKSPLNLKYRQRWARKHADVSPHFYFALDIIRLSKGLLFKK